MISGYWITGVVLQAIIIKAISTHADLHVMITVYAISYLGCIQRLHASGDDAVYVMVSLTDSEIGGLIDIACLLTASATSVYTRKKLRSLCCCVLFSS